MPVLEFLFFAIIGLGLVTYLGYPLAMVLAGWILPSRDAKKSETASPTVSIIIAAFNEAAHIKEKLESVLACQYDGHIEVLVADDGSTDNTTQIVHEVAHTDKTGSICVYTYPRRGKALALNDTVAKSTSDILVFTDADPIWTPSTLTEIVRPFSDDSVGAVTGVMVTTKKNRRFEAGERLFRNYENAIRKGEDRLFGCVSADGGLYAVRRKFFSPIPLGVTDDFFVSTGAVRHGTRIAFAPQALAYEQSIENERSHFHRRVRITVRGLTSLWTRRNLLNPFRFGAYAVGLIFHKLLRRVAPAFSLLLLPLSLALSFESPFFAWAAALQVAAYAGALLPMVFPGRLPRILTVPHVLLNHLLGLAVGVMMFCCGTRYLRWTPQKTQPES